MSPVSSRLRGYSGLAASKNSGNTACSWIGPKPRATRVFYSNCPLNWVATDLNGSLFPNPVSNPFACSHPPQTAAGRRYPHELKTHQPTQRHRASYSRRPRPTSSSPTLAKLDYPTPSPSHRLPSHCLDLAPGSRLNRRTFGHWCKAHQVIAKAVFPSIHLAKMRL